MSVSRTICGLLVLMMVFSACSSAEERIAVAIDQTLAPEKTFQSDLATAVKATALVKTEVALTQTALPTQTPKPLATLEPTATRIPTNTRKPSATVGPFSFNIPDPSHCPIANLEDPHYYAIYTLAQTEGYVWTFFQNETVIWDTWTDEGKLVKEAYYKISEWSEQHGKFQQGLATIQVRAKHKDGTWSEPAIVYVYFKPRALREAPAFDCPAPASISTPITPDEQCGVDFTRLAVGDTARIVSNSGGANNNVRSDPSMSAPIIAKFNAGQTVILVNGPICANGNIYWLVEGAFIPGALGWTAEGDLQTYWMEKQP